MARYEDGLMNDMVAEDNKVDTGGNKVDLFDTNKRWGAGTAFEMQPRKIDPTQPSSLDAENVRWWAEMNPVVGAMSGTEMILNDGKWVEGGLLIGGSIIPANTVMKLFGPAVKAGRNMIGKVVGGKYVSRDVMNKWQGILKNADDNLKMDRLNIDREASIMKKKSQGETAERVWGMIDEKIAKRDRGLGVVEKMKPKMEAYEKSHKIGQNLINRKKEGKEAYYKMEEYWQTSDLGLEPFLKQSKGDIELAKMMKKNYLRDEALNKGIISNKESEIILSVELGGNWSQHYDDLYQGIGLKREGAKIRKEVEEMLGKQKQLVKGSKYIPERYRGELDRPDMSKFRPEEMAIPAAKQVAPKGPDQSTINKLMSWFKDKL